MKNWETTYLDVFCVVSSYLVLKLLNGVGLNGWNTWNTEGKNNKDEGKGGRERSALCRTHF